MVWQTWNWLVYDRGGRPQSTTPLSLESRCQLWFLHDRITVMVHQRPDAATPQRVLVNVDNLSNPNPPNLTVTRKRVTLFSMDQMAACPFRLCLALHDQEIGEKTIMIGRTANRRKRKRESSTWGLDWSEGWRGPSFRSRSGKEGLREDRAFAVVVKMPSEDCSTQEIMDRRQYRILSYNAPACTRRPQPCSF
jgi:hypothetical protein